MLKALKKQKNTECQSAKMRTKPKTRPFAIYHSPWAFNGQVSLEFTFCMIVVLVMIYGIMRVFQWTGRDLAERNIAHTVKLESGSNPLQQIDPYFYTPVTMNAIWDGR